MPTALSIILIILIILMDRSNTRHSAGALDGWYRRDVLTPTDGIVRYGRDALPVDVLTEDGVLTGMPTRWLGRRAHVFDAIASTNTWLMDAAAHGAMEGTLALAEVQTAGRGRMGRQWLSPPGAGLLFSLSFRPLPPSTPMQVMMAVAVGVAAGLADRLGIEARLKWPNDILLDGGKLAGLLGEASMRLDGSRAMDVVVGCGLNVNLTAAELPPPPPGGTPPTSLRVVLGRPVARLPLLHAILAQIETRYEALRAGQSPLAEWQVLCATLGQPVVVTGSAGVVHGVAESVAADGSLQVRQADGKLVVVAAGDVTLRQS